MSEAGYQSPISPGRSFYEDSIAGRPRYPRLDGSRQADLVIVGGGFTGLSAAAHLAQGGARVVLLEAARLGDGASGRNGGQFGTGQRLWPEELEPRIGRARSRALFDLAEDAKRHLLGFMARHDIDADLGTGQLSVVHRKRLAAEYQAHAEHMARHYDYPHLSWHEPSAMAGLLGSDSYHGGLRDAATFHLNPMKLLVGTARVAHAAGAALHEQSPVTRLEPFAGGIRAHTPFGVVTAARALVATNGHGGSLEPRASAHIMPIRSYIAATAPLAEPERVLPGGEAVDDSRFVVRYFRKSADNRLLFGGREAYMSGDGDIAGPLRRLIAGLYPHLEGVDITHAWGGTVGITMTRMPYVDTPHPGLTVIGGFSGHGVMLSNFFGRLYAEFVAGSPDRLAPLRALDIPAFPGGPPLRTPLLFLAMTWFSLRDRL
ncbi:NAD(P)/FAD-dependent oxidoreductase [Aureimonas altamirensis]|uniref:NAD(P)/FAD-dependent oxidoreductase n=1 Tax=Aureimonas altamirensis TaxID=370622 RepID=UPI0025545A26|nr:FAD-binding oxidoreductase [Aureimonas altamirensis]